MNWFRGFLETNEKAKIGSRCNRLLDRLVTSRKPFPVSHRVDQDLPWSSTERPLLYVLWKVIENCFREQWEAAVLGKVRVRNPWPDFANSKLPKAPRRPPEALGSRRLSSGAYGCMSFFCFPNNNLSKVGHFAKEFPSVPLKLQCIRPWDANQGSSYTCRFKVYPRREAWTSAPKF